MVVCLVSAAMFLDFSNGVAVSEGFDEAETVAKVEAAEIEKEKITKDTTKETTKESEAIETNDTEKEAVGKRRRC